MAWRTEFAADAERDLALVFDHLVAAYRDFGDSLEEAVERAATRVQVIRASAERLATAPHRGTLHEELRPGLRHVTADRAVVWFELDEARQLVRILAIFFGGQDHARRMLLRLLTQ